jgi:hypothetical protein
MTKEFEIGQKVICQWRDGEDRNYFYFVIFVFFIEDSCDSFKTNLSSIII